MSKDKSIKKRKKREEKKKHTQGHTGLKKDYSAEEKSAGKMHIYVLVALTIIVSAFIIYSYSK
jgi:hypothetical protein